MSDDYHHLPILPASGSLASHLQALDLLAARLSALTTRSEWETRIHLNSKGSMMGKIVDTAKVKINIGGEWWVDMTAQEGEAWVRRRKAALLEEHAKVLEGWRPSQGSSDAVPKQATPVSESRFDTVFRSPVQMTTPPGPAQPVECAPYMNARSSEDPVQKASSSIASTGEAKAKDRAVAPPPASVPETKSTVAPTPAQNAKAGPSQSQLSDAPNTTIQDILESFMQNQDTLAKGTGKAGMPNAAPDDVMTNEEGLPIHEIREDENGQLIGQLPITAGASGSGSGGGVIEELPVDEEDDFWSEAAIARREALRRKVFDDPSDSESEGDNDKSIISPPTPPESSRAPSARPNVVVNTANATKVSAPSINAIPPTPSSPCPPLEAPVRRPSSSALPPKSILKTPAPRKKSVSFDSSVPEPPDSPAGPPSLKIGGSMFPTPVINIERGIEEKTVPVLNAPKRSPKRSTFGDPFAGFKPGFLGTNGKVAPPGSGSGSDTASGSVSGGVSEEPKTIGASIQEDQGIEDAAPKKKSLFAQRQRDAEETETLNSETKPPTSSSPSFPSMSNSKGTSSVKNVVLEKSSPVPVTTTVQPPPAGSSSRHTSSSASSTKVSAKPTQTAGVAHTVTERPNSIAGPSRLNGQYENSPLSRPDPKEGVHDDENDDDEDEDEDDDDDFYADHDDEGSEGYDLDDAMLAREVALAYHQNLAYTQLSRPHPDQQLTEEERDVQDYLARLRLDDELDLEAEGEGDGEGEGRRGGGGGGGGGVMMALPQISVLGEGEGGPRIINPTPDNLRQFVRVGKLDNGKLVLAPGEAGWSDDEDADADEGDDTDARRLAGDQSGLRKSGARGRGADSEETRKRENREEIRRALLGGQGVIEQKPPQPHPRTIDGETGLPPTIGVGPANGSAPRRQEAPKSAPAVSEVMEKSPAVPMPVADAPKKVSRFKANRMNG